jgi:hypothetical protein
VRLDVVVFVAAELLTQGRGTKRRCVTLDVLLLWLQILTWLVSHFSSFRNFADVQLDVLSDPDLPSPASKTQRTLQS